MLQMSQIFYVTQAFYVHKGAYSISHLRLRCFWAYNKIDPPRTTHTLQEMMQNSFQTVARRVHKFHSPFQLMHFTMQARHPSRKVTVQWILQMVQLSPQDNNLPDACFLTRGDACALYSLTSEIFFLVPLFCFSLRLFELSLAKQLQVTFACCCASMIILRRTTEFTVTAYLHPGRDGFKIFCVIELDDELLFSTYAGHVNNASCTTFRV